MSNSITANVVMAPALRAYLLAHDPADLKKRIDRFHVRALNGIRSDDFRNEIAKVLEVPGKGTYVLPTNIQPIPPGSPFFRARTLDHECQIETQDNVWEAPHGSSGPGRLNRQGESLLYTSISSRQTAALEVGVVPGKLFSMAMFSSVFTVSAAVMTQRHSDHSLPMRIRKNLEMVTGFLDDIFMQGYAQRDAHDYSATFALADELFNYPRQLQQGWVYRSVADPSPLGLNVCLRPEEAHAYLSLKAVTINICLSVDSMTGTIIVKTLRNLRPIGQRRFEEVPATDEITTWAYEGNG